MANSPSKKLWGLRGVERERVREQKALRCRKHSLGRQILSGNRKMVEDVVGRCTGATTLRFANHPRGTFGTARWIRPPAIHYIYCYATVYVCASFISLCVSLCSVEIYRSGLNCAVIPIRYTKNICYFKDSIFI